MAQHLTDLSILVKLNTEVPAYGHDNVHDYHQPAAGPVQAGTAVQLNLYKICQVGAFSRSVFQELAKFEW